MEDPSDKESKTNNAEEPSDHSTNGCHILQPAWLRCAFRPCDEVDGFLLDYRRYFLLPISIVLWTIFFIAQA
jgi:hypothetical protein